MVKIQRKSLINEIIMRYCNNRNWNSLFSCIFLCALSITISFYYFFTSSFWNLPVYTLHFCTFYYSSFSLIGDRNKIIVQAILNDASLSTLQLFYNRRFIHTCCMLSMSYSCFSLYHPKNCISLSSFS